MYGVILAAALVGQAGEAKWYKSSTSPGFEAYGVMNANGWVETQKFRRIDNPAVELPPASAVAGAQPVPAVVQPAPAPVVTGDPYGFTAWLNGVRASYGLSAVGYDPNLSAWAEQNNAQQAARGLGHFIMGPARRQNAAATGYFPGSAWMSSSGHRAALLDPSITMIGIAAYGAYWTYNAY